MNMKFKPLFIPESKYLPGGFEETTRVLEEANKEKRKLRIKLGIDPTSTDLHLGHTVCLHMLRKLQALGHIPVLIIGGFTATVGDPSGRNEARPPLSYEEVEKNAKTYLNQVNKILDTNKMEIVNNYEWLSKLSSIELVQLAHTVTVNQLIGKEAFGTRLEKGEPLYLHEVLYPILQGYDSYIVKADFEIGGIDQTFNILFGRHIQKTFKQKEQSAILLPLLIGLDGTKKMSKSFNNYIAINDPPSEVFGKTMSIPDKLISHYLRLVSTFTITEITDLENSLKSGTNPRDVKFVLAHNLVKQLYDENSANNAEENFKKQFQKNELPDSIPDFTLSESMQITDLLFKANLVESKSEAKRLITGGGVKLEAAKITDPNLLITEKNKNSILQVGKRKYIRIK